MLWGMRPVLWKASRLEAVSVLGAGSWSKAMLLTCPLYAVRIRGKGSHQTWNSLPGQTSLLLLYLKLSELSCSTKVFFFEISA